MVIYIENEEGDDSEEIEIPTKFEVCYTCRGKGSHVNPSVDGHGLTREDFDEDPDFKEAYFAGRYDVACYTCKGLRVVEVEDFDAMEPKLRARVEEHLAEDAKYEAAYDAACRMERMMGC